MTKILRVVVDRTGKRTERAVVVCRRRRRVVVVIVATEFAGFHNPDVHIDGSRPINYHMGTENPKGGQSRFPES